VTTLTRLQVRQEVASLFLLGLFEPGPSRTDDVVAVSIEFDDLGLDGLTDKGWSSRTRRSSTSEAGKKPRSPMSTMRPPLTTSMTTPLTTSSRFLELFDVGPGLFVTERAFWTGRVVPPCPLFATPSTPRARPETRSRRVDVVANREFARGNHAFGFETNIEQHFVTVDLDHGAHTRSPSSNSRTLSPTRAVRSCRSGRLQ